MVTGMPLDEEMHSKRLLFYYAECAQHCDKRGGMDCKGIDVCMLGAVFE